MLLNSFSKIVFKINSLIKNKVLETILLEQLLEIVFSKMATVGRGMSVKTHAKDYLNEFKESQPLWMQELINEAINTNGKIANEGFKRIYRILKTDEISYQEASKSSFINITDKLTIKKLTHNSGINAFASSRV